ncbi:hypothetical protein COL5a_009445 [Colletotrichum fioriniae]|uniref:uncharacterized protein n=1 Tax=Colletotrichum fioriniae TaxID=710243 RepID=UPI00230084C3|nr:uncharacterized protein COL516b_009605 [Colletotrichum fioriniae]KAJ0298803.1 hypothetical protein COL516b_009605 [Colletotrichum fioriniae]KAJ0321115.1 hypothetical protein COL5a_009445 [Colletotrichum fioriniae]KAJ3942315.1 hypothetical protein N0V96_007813 [Colletotrichum fioriniae]
MPTLRRRREASRPVEEPEVDETTSNAIEPIASHLERLDTAPDGTVEALAVVNDATEVAAAKETEALQIGERDRDHQHPRKQRSHLPKALQFPLVTVLSFSISSLCYSFLSEWSRGELAGISKSLDTWGEVATLAGWRIFELALGWFGNFDSYDLAALNLLAHGPPVYLIATFYNISTATAISALGIEMLSTFLPFQLLRPLSGAHAGAKNVANREILTDIPIQIYTTILSAAIYSLTLFTAYKTYLPTTLVVYFQGLPSLAPAYTTNFLATLPVTVAFGVAAKSFIFTPFVATGETSEDEKLAEFDPATATLGETLAWNIWGYTTRAKVVILRTVVAMVVTGVNTYLQTFMTVNGVESYGATAYSGAWVAAAFFTGIGLAFVGGGDS